jgi:ELWxxDGT repeat protein
MLLDIFPGSRSASPSGFFQIEPGVVGFVADDGISGAELWRTDGTPQGTRMIADLNPGPEPSAPMNVVVLANRVWFSAFTREQGRELWRMPTGSVSLCDYDFNQDENVDLVDAQQMALVAAGLITSEDAWLTGDLNRDENADLADAQILAGYLTTGVCPI